MLATTFLLLLLQGLFQYPQLAGDGLDEATRQRMEQRAEYLQQQMAWLMQELQHDSLEQSAGAWPGLLLWQLCAVLAMLLLLLVLEFGLKEMIHDAHTSGHKESSSSNLEEEEEEGDNVVAKEAIESKDANVEADSCDGGEEGPGVDAKEESSSGREAKEGCDDTKEEVNKDEKGDEVNPASNEEDKHGSKEEDHEANVQRNFGRPSEEHVQLRVPDVDEGCLMIRELMEKLRDFFGQSCSDTFYPVPQEAIGVGSAFEGWSACAEDVVYQVLVPLSPPPGHAFQLELATAGMARRKFRMRVELLCTCTREQRGEAMLCFLHQPEVELRRKQEASLLHTLCTGCYLDVEKTVHWFCRLVRVAWLLLPQSRHWHLMVQPCSCSCKFVLSKDKQKLALELILGVWQGDSDIFVGSQPTAGGVPSTTWLETYAVAEAKFFRHISRQAPQDSCHCKCLQLLSRMLMGVGFPSYTLKTVVMHLLSTVPLTRWCRRDFRQRLLDIFKYLQCSLETKRLNHFVMGNESFPPEITLPSDVRAAEALNLFQHLASNPDAHAEAMQEHIRLLQRLQQVLLHGH